MKRSAAAIFAGEGASRAAARAVDWSKTSLGAPETWPISLLTTLAILLHSRHPMFLWWGPELIQFYNDAYLPSFGRGKHPAAMGQRGADCWQEIWPIIDPQIDDVMSRSQASWNEDQLVPIHRNGRIEEVYWTYGYSPVFDEAGLVGGVLVVCTETTAGVLAVRRLELIRKLASALHDAQDSSDVARITAKCLDEAKLDVPFGVVAVHGVDPLVVGLETSERPTLVGGECKDSVAPRSLSRGIACQAWPELVTQAMVHSLDGEPGGTLTFGLSPRLPLDPPYRSFLQQVVDQVAAALGRVAIETERRRLLLQAPVAAALLTGPEHVYEIANPRYVQMVGREVLGKRYIDAFPEAHETELPRILDRVYHHGEPFTTQEMLVRLAPDEGGALEDRFFNFNLEPIRDVRGKVYGMMVVALDITAQVSARNALKRSHDERVQLLAAAEVASRAKDEFLAMLGHELRNPLAPIVTALELMKLKKVEGLEREREIIERQASRVIHLVDDLLDVARVAEGKIELKKRRLPIADVVSAAIEMASPLLEKRRHELRVEVPSEGLDVYVDPIRLGQVVANLLTNAARYTEPGGTVSIHAGRVDQDVVLRVVDTGIGIPEEQIPRLFERFFQGSRPDGAHGGLGLGLALVKGLIELHGGSVRAASAGRGKGSTFEVRLALATGEGPRGAAATEAVAQRDAAGERVLLIDDSDDITDSFASFLRLHGFDVRTAGDGPSALRIAATYKPTVCVLDLGLPVMDGYEIAAKLVEQMGRAAPRLIAVSGYGARDDFQRTRRAGFERHLVKPVDAAALLRAVSRDPATS